MKKKLVALFLALVLCLGLAIPVSADFAPIVVSEKVVIDKGNGTKSITSKDYWAKDGDSGNGWSLENEVLTLNNFDGVYLDISKDRTIVLAPGSKNKVESISVGFYTGNGSLDVTLTIEGSGEIDFYNRSTEYSTFNIIPGAKIVLGTGLVMTGGQKQGEKNPLTFNSDGYPVTSDGTKAKYVHIGPDTGTSTQKPVEPTTKNTKFTDVPSSSPYAKAIVWAVENDIAKGKTDTTFAPNETCNRRHLEIFLWRAHGSPSDRADISDSLAATIWATQEKLIPFFYKDGESEAFYALPCTRSLAMTYMWKLAGSPEPKKTASFTDVPANADYAKAVSWAVEQGITTGTSATTFSPDKSCTRGQIVTFLYRASK